MYANRREIREERKIKKGKIGVTGRIIIKDEKHMDVVTIILTMR
jgi:hypothetical protein